MVVLREEMMDGAVGNMVDFSIWFGELGRGKMEVSGVVQ